MILLLCIGSRPRTNAGPDRPRRCLPLSVARGRSELALSVNVSIASLDKLDPRAAERRERGRLMLSTTEHPDDCFSSLTLDPFSLPVDVNHIQQQTRCAGYLGLRVARHQLFSFVFLGPFFSYQYFTDCPL